MNLIWHLIKFNFIFNKLRLIFLTFVSTLILTLSYYLNETLELAGGDMLQYSLYGIFIIVVGKLNYRSTIMFDVKHMQSLPISKKEMVWAKSLADVVHYFPVSLVLCYGFALSFPNYHMVIVFFLIHLVLFVANMIAFNKRIDFARMQYSQTSFKNTFLYFNKYFDSMIVLFFVAVIGTILIGGLKDNILLQEYALLVFVIIFSFLVFSRTVKILNDETLSYFLVKRDLIRIGVKFVFIGIPTILLFKSEPILKKKLKQQLKNNNKYVKSLNSEYEKMSLRVDEKRLILALTNNDEKEIETYLLTHKDLPWDVEVMGGYLPHIAAGSGNLMMLEEIAKRKPEFLNMQGKYKKRTPLFTAMANCQLEAAQYLIGNGVDLNQQDINGDTPAIFAARNKCYGGVIMLNQVGADFSIINKKEKDVYTFIQGTGIDHFLPRKQSRSIASEKPEKIKVKTNKKD